MKYYTTSTDGVEVYSPDTGWVDEAYQTIEITEEQEVSDEFAAYVAANSEEVLPNEYLISRTLMESIADATRSQRGITGKIPGSQIPAEILAIEKGITPTGTISIAENGTIDVTNYASAEVNVPIPDEYIIPEGSIEITENGSYDVTALKTAEVNVPQLDTSDATATSAHILEGETAYVNGVKVTGTIPIYNGEIVQAVSLINFTIDYVTTSSPTTYQAEQGMTWADWVANTTYNTDGFYIDDTKVYNSNDTEVDDVTNTSTIVADKVYYYVYEPSGSN